MSETTPDQNKAFVLEAFDTLFNRRDYVAAERFWSPAYIQHSAHIGPGRKGLFDLIRSVPSSLHYENHVILAEGDYVIAHGRFTGTGRDRAWVAADVVRFEDGLLKEHWDVLQDEVTAAESASGLPMFGDTFPKQHRTINQRWRWYEAFRKHDLHYGWRLRDWASPGRTAAPARQHGHHLRQA